MNKKKCALLPLIASLSLLTTARGYSSEPGNSPAHADRPSHAVRESRYIRIGGIDQWITIRGDDAANPVLLWLNGGPGASTVPSSCLYKSWEQQFTVVMWDQRGEGKTFEKSGESVAASMTIDKMSSDGVEVAQYLKRRLHKGKIILLGHSWGSILGVHMIMKRPDIFAAYVGTGQVINLRQQFEAGYSRLRERAATNPEAKDALDKIGPPPWNDPESYHVVNVWSDALDPPSKVGPEVCAAEKRVVPPHYIQAGAQLSNRMLFDAIGKEDMFAVATKFAVPVIFIQGGDDLLTTTAVVRQYFDKVDSPRKKFIELPGTGHLAIFRDPDAFREQLEANVRPMAIE